MNRIGQGLVMSQATRCGQVVHVSGQIAWGKDGEVVGEHGSRVQADQALSNLLRVLAEAGCNRGDVAKLTCYLTDAAQYPDYAAAKQAVFGGKPPASTTVVVAALLDPRLSIEVEAVAIHTGASRHET